MNGAPGTPSGAPAPQRRAALIDLLDRLLSGGVVLTGDLVLSIADIDLVRISLRALILSVGEQNPSARTISVPPGGEPP
ncbi:gas vesicle protein [Kitasatospora sp. NPDC050463]|uniref:gas vesicle protein n=1 Tax=Kitasatospora sp. NPDC050463 TaxID=3155786 RepID=UPI0033FE87A9